jgi:Predicted nucleotide-binding protein containing TIR-like domain
MEKRIFVSATANAKLDERRLRIKRAILDRISRAGYKPQEFWESGIAENLSWNFENVDRVMRKSVGAVIIGFHRYSRRSLSLNREVKIVGEFNHYEGAVALTYRLPVLLLKEDGVEDRGIVYNGGGRIITYMPNDVDDKWVDSKEFAKRFDAWLRELEVRKDVFLGYCSKTEGIASQIQLLIQKTGASVHNWGMDFRVGGSILSEIENARSACSCGVFLFSEDDPLEDAPGVAAPRDNVVFEAGYFMSSKGPERCLIIRHGDAKMPADVGGAIYLHLGKNMSVSSIEGRLRDFLAQNL